MNEKYIYGIVDSCNEFSLGIAGIGGGIVYPLSHRGVSCLLSDYDGEEFNSMAKKDIVRHSMEHQSVVENAMKKYTLLPVKFGTLLTSQYEVRNLLEQGHQKFVDVLAWIADKVELEIAATCNMHRMLQGLRKEEDIAQKQKQVALDECISLEKMFKASIERRKNNYRERITNYLSPIILDVHPNIMNPDDMVINMAFLIEKTNQDRFNSMVWQLNNIFRDEINLHILGPLPPYSFAMVEVTKLSPEEIDAARHLLHLSENFSELDVDKAYHYLAKEAHPNGKQEERLTKMRSTSLRQAYNVLIARCRCQTKQGEHMLINIRRQSDKKFQRLLDTQRPCVSVNMHS